MKPELVAALRRIKNCYTSIHLMSLHCISENIPQGIPALMSNREEVLSIIQSEETKIAGSIGSDDECLKIRQEIAAVIKSIAILDKQLEIMIKGSMEAMSREFSAVYKKSRAVCAYTAHSMT